MAIRIRTAVSGPGGATDVCRRTARSIEMLVRSVPRIAALASISLVVAGCGSAKPSFVVQADAICAQANERIAALPAPADTVAGYAGGVQAEVPIVRREVRRLAALTPPRSKRAAFKATLDDARADVALADSMVDDLDADDRSRLSGLLAESAKLDRSTRIEARVLGIRDCARSGSQRKRSA
jgi:hypothetical protein